MNVLSITLPGFPPLPNAMRRDGSWHARAESARTWRHAAFLAATQALRESEYPEDFPLKQAVVEIVVITPNGRAPDPDNAVAAVKPCLDGMVQAGVLKGDSFTTIGRLSVTHETGPSAVRISVLMGAA